MQEINKALSISTKLSTSFHPQMDGQTEIINKEVQKFLQIYCFKKQDQWANWLAIAQFSINIKKHASTKVAPFKATWSYILSSTPSSAPTPSSAVTNVTNGHQSSHHSVQTPPRSNIDKLINSVQTMSECMVCMISN